MKNLIFLLAATMTLSMISCENIDKELAGKMQKDVSEMSGLAATFEDIGKSIANLDSQMQAAPEAMKAAGNPELNRLMEMIGAMTQKHQSTAAEYNDLMNKLKGLAADYSAGKIATVDAQKEYDTLKMGLQGVSDLTQRIQERATAMQTSYAKLTADWNAKQEGTAPAPQ
ncbi:MAG: hypothetical protein IPJ82_15970 [Lewinellaceae bacterium]|nr:hypothetical protein [Lewinellaceae bacterium]